MRVRVLGPVEVIDDAGVPVAVGSRNQRLVLAVLACQPGRTVAAARLIDALWGDEPPRTATHSLRTYVSRLRHVLGDRLAIRPGGYALDLPADAVDASEFEALLREAEVYGPAAVELLGDALALWRGPAFGDLAEVDALRGVAVRLDELRLGAREARAAAMMKTGHAVEAAALAEELVAEEPLREGAWSPSSRPSPRPAGWPRPCAPTSGPLPRWPRPVWPRPRSCDGPKRPPWPVRRWLCSPAALRFRFPRWSVGRWISTSSTGFSLRPGSSRSRGQEGWARRASPSRSPPGSPIATTTVPGWWSWRQWTTTPGWPGPSSPGSGSPWRARRRWRRWPEPASWTCWSCSTTAST